MSPTETCHKTRYAILLSEQTADVNTSNTKASYTTDTFSPCPDPR